MAFVVDSSSGIDATYGDILEDTINLQLVLKRMLPDALEESLGLLLEDSPFVFVLAPAGYPFLVAALAILSIGGAHSPIGLYMVVTSEEEYAEKSKRKAKSKSGTTRRQPVLFV
ncbi:uncharacterized protein BDV17DRAFT_295783 [Aspergillus undulatus]|uniref:uncharacterized protein n=1 Tax=Aspergillus undulatus TaxID=1810928 RepID=UPI003CCE220B